MELAVEGRSATAWMVEVELVELARERCRTGAAAGALGLGMLGGGFGWLDSGSVISRSSFLLEGGVSGGVCGLRDGDGDGDDGGLGRGIRGDRALLMGDPLLSRCL